MSNILIKKELRSLVRNSGYEANSNMLCSLVRIITMKYSDIESQRVVCIANEIIKEKKL